MVTMFYIKEFTLKFLITLNKNSTNLPTVTYLPLIDHEIVLNPYLMTSVFFF